ncbi:hypothetical protein SY83_02680 [Paenibacillus swuensis]|uniref:non-specific protein-tyrosine kinase n=1 Tax=Paenibacillus swuensis TaxID=1178515 RepID=A0A172TED4_9BACL|nr:CpsD/CapB family tyrosine-protein kinase [Paenibacillus swuensis]ANE45408.1 hypothetical protein SY83_02680 [Paenibacillus swuensis]
MRRNNTLSSSLHPNDYETPITEAYRTIRTAIKFAAEDQSRKVLLFCSSIPGEGKTSIIANLGRLFAQDHKAVLLLDGDLRRPHLHSLFALNNRTGLSSILLGYSNPEESVQSTQIPNLSVLTAGPIQPNAAELLGSPRLEETLSLLKDAYDIILVDAPSLLTVSDAQLLAQVADGIVLVIRSQVTHKEQLIKAQQFLEPFRPKVLGAILNDRS